MKIKKLASILLVVAMVTIVLATSVFAVSHYERYLCTGNGVNVRSGPSTSYPSYGYLNQSETFWSQMIEGSYGDFRYGQCPDYTGISQAYGYALWGYVGSAYLNYVG